MKSYKYKIEKDKDCSDADRASPRKAFNSSERLKAKTAIRNEIDNLPQFSKQEMSEIRYDLYEESHQLCRSRNIHEQNIASVFIDLKIIGVKDYYFLAEGKCTCPNYHAMTDLEILHLAGYIHISN